MRCSFSHVAGPVAMALIGAELDSVRSGTGQGTGQGLAIPTGLWAAQTSPTQITLVWDSVPGALGFKISSKSGVINVAKLTRYIISITTMFGIPLQYYIEAIGEKGLISLQAQLGHREADWPGDHYRHLDSRSRSNSVLSRPGPWPLKG